MQPKILIVYPNLPLMMAPAISVGIFHALALSQGCQVQLFETTEYSDTYSNRHIRMTEIGANRPNTADEVADMFHIKPTSDIIPDFIKTVDEFKPDLILMSVQEDVWGLAKQLLASIADRNIEHILGGIFCTSVPDLVMSNPLVKRICIGEGEHTVSNIIDAIKNQTDINAVAGIWYKDRFGLVQRNPPAELCDISAITPDFTCFESKRWQRPMGGKMFQRAISLETYRGCPYNCTYCNSPLSRDTANGKFLRRKSAACIERELLQYKELYDPDLVLFVDDSFLARPKKEIFEFCAMWSKYQIPFWFNTRIENCDPDVLAALKDAGVYRMTFGLESGNESYRRDFLDRPVSNETYKEYFEYINASNIPYSLNVIIGMPFETRDMVLETAALVQASGGYDGLTVSVFQPYHGTKLRDVCVANNYIDKDYINGTIHGDQRGGLLDSWVLNMPDPYLQKSDVDALVKTFALYAHFDTGKWDEIRQAETNDELYAKLMAEYQIEFFGDIQQGGADRIQQRYCLKHDATGTYNYEIY